MILMYNNKCLFSSLFPLPNKLKREELTYGIFLKEFENYFETIREYFNNIEKLTGDKTLSVILFQLYKENFEKVKKKVTENEKDSQKRDTYSNLYSLSVDDKFKQSFINIVREYSIPYEMIMDNQLMALSIKTKEYSEKIEKTKIDENARIKFLNNRENILDAFTVMSYYVRKVRLNRALIRPNFLKQFLMISPELVYYDNPIYLDYKEFIQNSPFRYRFKRDGVYTIGGSPIEEQEDKTLFITKADIIDVFKFNCQEMKSVDLLILLFFKRYGLFSEEVTKGVTGIEALLYNMVSNDTKKALEIVDKVDNTVF